MEFYLDDPFTHWKRLRKEAPVHWYQPEEPGKEGFWCVLRHHDLQDVSRRPKRFASSHGTQLFEVGKVGPVDDGGLEVAGSIIRLDPPEHNRHRKLVMPSFTPQRIGRLEPRIREIARNCLASLAPGEELDFVAGAAVTLPMLVIAELLGVPSDRLADFKRWSDAVVEVGGGSSSEASRRGMGELIRFFRERVEERRNEPRDDLVSIIVGSEIDGARLAGQDAVMFCVTLLVAGNETTRNLISGGTLALLQHPEQCAALLARPSLIPNAVEEMLRWHTPVLTFVRRAMEDTELGGEKIRRGDFVALFYGSANRDELVFGEDAEAFDIARADARRHLSFGFGEHLCLGASLARLEARVFFEELLPRLSGLTLAGTPQWLPSFLMRGLQELPVRFES